MQYFFLYNDWLRNSFSFNNRDKFSVNESDSTYDMESVNATAQPEGQQLSLFERGLKSKSPFKNIFFERDSLNDQPETEIKTGNHADREKEHQSVQQAKLNVNKVRSNPYLWANFNDAECVENLYQRATFIEKAAIHDNVVFIYYDPFRKVDEGRTLIITADVMLIRTKTLPQKLMQDFRLLKRNRNQMLEQLNIQKEDKNTPFVCGNAAYVPIISGYRKYQSWLAVHWVDSFINIQKPSTLVQAECICPISIKLNIRYGRFYPALYLGFIIWKYQRAAFKTMYHMFLGYNDFPILNFPHYYMQLLFQEDKDSVFALNEELKNLSKETLNELMENWLNEDMSQYFQ